MVDHDPAAILYDDAAVRLALFTTSVGSHPDMLDDYIMRVFDDEGGKAIWTAIVSQQYPSSRRGLPGDRDIGVSDDRSFGRISDDATHSEDADPWPRHVDAGAERPRSGIGQ
jgi:hypothetical protein